jgi:hydroxymethylpyrimidine pyrophosphatase-like HAD family hydrolase
VIAIGDNLNDLEMIREAGLGVAVDNAHPRLKEEARYIANSNLNHAVAEVIEKYCLKK